jgi:hypothetical protein
MAALDFPNSPTVGQVYTTPAGQVWKWDGAKWVAGQNVLPAGGVVLEVNMGTSKTGLTAGAWNVVKYDTKITDTQNAYNAATGVFTPTQPGLYLVVASVAVVAGAAGTYIGAGIRKNGAQTTQESMNVWGTFGGTNQNPTTVSALIYCNGSSDFIDVVAWLPGGITSISNTTNAGFAVNMVATLLNVGAQGPAGPAGSGAWVLINTLTASNSPSLVFPLTGGYRRYRLSFDNLINATTGNNLPGLQFSTDGGSTWLAAASYLWGAARVDNTGAVTGGGSAAGTLLSLAFGGDPSALTATGVSGEALISNPAGGTNLCLVNYDSVFHGSNFGAFKGGGRYNVAGSTPINAVRTLISAGNIASGVASLYGILS